VPRLRIALATALAALALPTLALPSLALPASARAGAYSRVLGAYQQTGSIPPCAFSSAQLQSALKSVSTYGAQYFADFTNAIQNALAARAAGRCSTPAQPAGAAGASVSGATPRTGALTADTRLGPVTAATNASLPAPLLAMAAIAVVLAALVAVAALARTRGWDPAWAAASRHSWQEAGYRVSALWAEFRDWLRWS
jgi:hypothetical protein